MVEVILTPHSPGGHMSMRAILNSLGYVQIGPENAEADLIVAWNDTTFPTFGAFPMSRWGVPPINGRCFDISKRRVEEVFFRVFGYPLDIDPSTFSGPCIEKNNGNAFHDVRLRECPIPSVPGRIYERYVDTTTADGHFEDIRIPVIGREIPLCWRRIKAANDLPGRFDQRFDRSIPVPAVELMSTDELWKIVTFCSEMGLDFCELDGGRDRHDGRLYIFDANSTPTGPPKSSTEEEKRFAIEELAAAFARQFQPQCTIVR